MFGPQLNNLPRVLTILGACLANPELVTDVKAVQELLQKLQKELPPGAFEAAFSLLPKYAQENLK